jgi:hypothetical protein
MATGWQAFPLELNGGLISNMSRLQQGLKASGSARRLINFEPSVKGGYRRINGFTKYTSSYIPTYGSPVVQGSSQSGTSLVIANIFVSITSGSTFQIAGVSGTYTVASSSFSSINKETTLTITPTLASSPADKATITFSNKTSKTEGLHFFVDTANNVSTTLVYRDGNLYSSTGSTFTNQTVPNYGSTNVKTSGQSGTNLIVQGFTSDTDVARVGDTFTIAGVEKVYTVLSAPPISSGHGTISIYPALASSPADTATVTFTSRSMAGGTKARFINFNYDGTERTVMVDSTNYPITWGTNEGLKVLDSSSSILGSEVVASFKDHLFFGKGSNLVFSAPFLQNDFTPANGAGSIRLPSRITGLITFRDKLIIFTNSSIHQLTGTASSSFQLAEISEDLGCSEPDTIQEVGGDIMFLARDGLRFLGATARIGDFNLSVASRNIQDNITEFTSSYADVVSLTIRSKSQYRIMGFASGQIDSVAEGYIGTQFADQDASSFSWSQTKGIKAYRTTSATSGSSEVILFVGETGYIYRLDTGNTFDGSVISASFFTPFMSINDPKVRKTLFKATTYYDPEGNVDGNLTFKYDFQRPNVIQPLSGGGEVAIFGSAIFGDVSYGGDPETVIETNTTGSFFTVSLQYEFTTVNNPPFIVDTVLLEYSNNDRK